MQQASPEILTKLRELGRTVNMLSLQSRAYSRAHETSRSFRQRINERMQKLKSEMERHRMFEYAQRFPKEHGPQLVAKNAEIAELEKQLEQSKIEDEQIHERWKDLNTFVGTNSERLDEALKTINKTRDDVGIPWDGDARYQNHEVIQV